MPDNGRRTEKIPLSFQMFFFLLTASIINSSYAPLDPFIEHAFGFSLIQIGFISSAAYLGAISASVISSILVDYLGPWNSMKITYAAIAVSAAILVSEHDFIIFLLSYYLFGLGYGIVTPSTNKLIMKRYSPNHSVPMGIKQAGIPVGTSMGAILLPVIALRLGLPHTYLVADGFIIAILFFLVITRRRESGRSKAHFNILKVYREAISNKTLGVITLLTAFFAWTQLTLLTYFAIYLESSGLPLLHAEFFLFIMLAGAALGRIFWTYIHSRYKRSLDLYLLPLLGVLIAIMILLFREIHTANYIEAGLFAFSLGATGISWNGVFVSLISEVAPRDRIGSYSGVSMSLMFTGAFVGPPVSGYLISTYSYNVMWTVLGIAVLGISLACLAAMRIVKRGMEGSSPVSR